jgi:CheY-like chemotaxis protein
MNRPTIVVWTPSVSQLAQLVSSIDDRFDVMCTSDRTEALASIEAAPPAVFLIDPKNSSGASADAIRRAREMRPNLPIILLTSLQDATSYRYLQLYGVGAAFPYDTRVSPLMLRRFIDHVVDPARMIGIRAFLPPGHEYKEARVWDRASRRSILETLLADFGDLEHSNNYDLHLTFDEMINNATFHAFRHGDDTPKYVPLPQHPFDEDDEIAVQWCRCDKSHGLLVVSDNRGKLDPNVVWDRFYRQVSLTGLLDPTGRGLYLVYLLSGLTMITVTPGRHTQLAVLFGPGSKDRDNPISIQTIVKP